MKMGQIALAALYSLIGLAGVAGILPTALIGFIVLLTALAAGGMAVRAGRTTAAPLNLKQREDLALKLRASRERERAFYDLASTLSATLDYNKVLETAQDIGKLATYEMGTSSRIFSAAFLFEEKTRLLRVAHARNLTQTDMQRVIEGKAGVLGLALKQGQTEPVFATMPDRDPELQYFVAFQSCKSILALPLRAGFDHYGVLVFGCDQPDAFSTEYIELLKAIGTLATIALQNAVLYQNILEEKERIVEVEEDARKKLARDLHDGPTQSVAAIAMRVNYIRRLLEQRPQQAGDELVKVEELARRTTKEIRHMLFTLRPLVLETQGLVAALGQLSEKMRDNFETNVVIEAQNSIERWLDAHGQGVIFYIIEEAVNNARKHAQSEHIWVRLKKQEQVIIVEIEDDGVGFDSESVMKDYSSRGSLGMVNMRERAELVEGTLHLTSKAGQGTKISIVVPIREGTLSQQPAPSPTATQSTAAIVPPFIGGDAPPSPETPPKPQIRPIQPPAEKAPIPYAGKRSPST